MAVTPDEGNEGRDDAMLQEEGNDSEFDGDGATLDVEDDEEGDDD